MAGQVQMVYIDPPYASAYGSNFQPFVNRAKSRTARTKTSPRNQKWSRAFRDTWELGIHSYLTYLRDRLFSPANSSQNPAPASSKSATTNLHLVRGLMDEVFSKTQFCFHCYQFAKTSD